MVIIGGMGSIMGSFFGAGFIVILPIVLSRVLPALGDLVGVELSTAAVSHAELMTFGGLIVWFLIVEPHGLAKLWSIGSKAQALALPALSPVLPVSPVLQHFYSKETSMKLSETHVAATIVAAGAASLSTGALAQDKEQFFPLLSCRARAPMRPTARPGPTANRTT